MASEKAKNLKIRRLLLSDKRTIQKMVKDIWDGHDFLPYIYDKWVKDRKGGFYGAVVENKVVGCVKVSEISPGEIWLEGIRVDPAMQGRGISWHLQNRALKRAFQMNPKTIRFVTAPVNEGSKILGLKGGFEIVTEPWFCWKEVKPVERVENIVRITSPDIAWDFIINTDEYKKALGMEFFVWKAMNFSKHRLEQYCKKGFVHGLINSKGTLTGIGLMIPSEGRFENLTLRFVAGDVEPLIQYTLQRAGDYSFSHVSGLTCLKQTHEKFKELGFEYMWGDPFNIEIKMLVFEYKGKLPD